MQCDPTISGLRVILQKRHNLRPWATPNKMIYKTDLQDLKSKRENRL